MRILLFLFASLTLVSAQEAATYETKKDISYYDEAALRNATDYQKQQCKLDVYHAANRKGLPTVIWFHGGGLTAGNRSFAGLQNQEVNLVAVSYRFAPPGEFPCFLEDAAAATAWTFRHIAEFGGDPKKIFVSGHSAGGYLTLMIGEDPKWLAPYQISIHDIAGLIPVSAQVTTHFHVKKLRGDTGNPLRPLIDEYAPLYFASKDLPPICLITGDRKLEYKCRVEENDLFAITLKNMGHPDIEFHEMPGYDHGSSPKGAWEFFMPFIRKVLAAPAVEAK